MRTHLNLMTTAAQRKAALRMGIRRWAVIYAISAVSILFSSALLWWDCDQAERKKAYLEHRYAPINDLKVAIRTTEAEIQSLRQAEKVALALGVRRPPLTLVGAVSQAASRGNVCVQHWDVRQAPLELTSDHATSLCQLRGVGKDDTAIADFVDNLRSSEVFVKVDLKSTVAKKLEHDVVREFQVECTF